MDARLLACAYAYGLAVQCIADRIALCVFERNQCNQKICFCGFRYVLRFGYDVIEQLSRNRDFVASLLKADAVNLLDLRCSRSIRGVDFNHIVLALLLLPEYRKCFLRIAGGNHAVRDLALNEACGIRVTDIRKGNEVSEARHAIGTAGSCVSAGKRTQFACVLDPVDFFQDIRERASAGSTRRRDMLERGRRRKTGRLF